MFESLPPAIAVLRPCVACRVPFDLAHADFCACLATDRTFRCPGCGCCACDQPLGARNEFWGSAPRVLWERRREQAVTAERQLQALDRNSVKRPVALIIDDDPRILMQAAAALRRLGFSTIELDRPGAAAQIARMVVPELVLTDALMPRLDGRELCRQLKTDPETSSIRVIVMSSLYKGTVHRNEAFKKFLVDEFLEKPVRFAVLRDAVQRLVPDALAAGEERTTAS